MAEVVQILMDKERLQPLADSIKTLKGSDADITLAGMEDTIEEANSDVETMAGLIEELEAALEGKSVEGSGATVETCEVLVSNALDVFYTGVENGVPVAKMSNGVTIHSLHEITVLKNSLVVCGQLNRSDATSYGVEEMYSCYPHYSAFKIVANSAQILYGTITGGGTN